MNDSFFLDEEMEEDAMRPNYVEQAPQQPQQPAPAQQTETAPPKPTDAPEGFYYRLVGRKGQKTWKLYKKPDTQKMREARAAKKAAAPAPAEVFDRDKYMKEFRESQETQNKQILDQLVQLNSYWKSVQQPAASDEEKKQEPIEPEPAAPENQTPAPPLQQQRRTVNQDLQSHPLFKRGGRL